jgi:hypothetical protein
MRFLARDLRDRIQPLRTACLAILLTALATAALAQNRSRAQIIRDKMHELAVLSGSWEATYTFHSREGPRHDDQEIGTQVVSWALDTTYLLGETERHSPGNASKRRLQLTLLTWNPDSSRYELSYFYSGSSQKVFELGEYSAVRREFTTRAFIPLEDGVRDENVRTVTSIASPDAIIYEHYSRYSDEVAERNDLTVTLRRVKRSRRTGPVE